MMAMYHLQIIIGALVASIASKEIGSGEQEILEHDMVLHKQQKHIQALEDIIRTQTSISLERDKKLDELDKIINEIVARPRTCHEIRSKNASSPSDMYWIDPDGHDYGEPPIQVMCNMETGTTFIAHNSEETMDVGHCGSPGCYGRDISYKAPMNQIVALIEQSAECKQWIQYDCHIAPLQFSGVDFSWWLDRYKNRQFFWAGDGSHKNHTCQCGIENNCIDRFVCCNCDSYMLKNLTDQGFVTKKQVLPVTGLRFGRTLDPKSSGRHKLGQLQCSGQTPVQGVPKSCQDLKLAGHTLNAFYQVYQHDRVETVFCDMTSSLISEHQQHQQDGEPRFHTGLLPLFFYAHVNQVRDVSGSPIPFPIASVNYADALNLKSGVFRAPIAGVYAISFTALTSDKDSQVQLNIGDEFSVNSVRTDGQSRSCVNCYALSLSCTVHIERDDEVKLILIRGTIDDDDDHYNTHYSAVLLHADREEYIP